MSLMRKAVLALWLSVVAFAMATASAAAEPILQVALDRQEAPITRSDERLAYQVRVANAASENPSVGEQLRCQGKDGKVPDGNPEPDVEIWWLRDGVPIPGTKGPADIARFYTTVPDDAGRSIQCAMRISNDPNIALGTSSYYGIMGQLEVSLPPVVVEPLPSPAPPLGTRRPNTTGGAATPAGTASTTAGSRVLENVITARGTGTLTAGSTHVENLVVSSGWFGADSAPFEQAATGPGIAPPAVGTATAKRDTNVLTNVNTSEGTFMPGQAIYGQGIGQDVKIVGVGPETVELSRHVFAEGTIEIRAYTYITAVDSDSLELSVPALASGPTEVSAGGSPFFFGAVVTGPGIPPDTTVTKLEGRRVTLSQPATASAEDVPVTGTQTMTCDPPDDWSGEGITWTFQWLRNGEPIPGATDPQYTVQTADTQPPSRLQCLIRAEDGSGRAAVAVSLVTSTRPAPSLPYGIRSWERSVEFSSTAEGEVGVDLELPAGTQALHVTGPGWKCAKVRPTPLSPATARCRRQDPLPPGDEYPPIDLAIQVGADAPEPLTTRARASGGGGSAEGEAEDQLSGLLPAVPFDFASFRIDVLDDKGDDYTQAGGHPFSAGASLSITEHMRGERSAEAGLRAANGFVRVVRTDTPPGFVGNPQAVSELCPALPDVVELPTTCPEASAIGGITVETEQGTFRNLPLFAVEREYGTAAQFAFGIATLTPGPVYTLTPELRPQDGYAIRLTTAPIQKFPELFAAKATLCAFGARLGPNVIPNNKETEFKGCRKASEAVGWSKPFLTLPTRCDDPAATTTEISADSWENPGEFVSARFTAPLLKGCEAVPFAPAISLEPTSIRADSPTGLDVELTMPTGGLESMNGIAGANLANSVVRLPVGMSVNPAVAAGLGVCTQAQLGMHNGVPDDSPVRCPESSKIGRVEIETPLLAEKLTGDVYVAAQGDNPFGSLLALYLVVESKQSGILIKIPGKVVPDPQTGQLTTSFEENPQAPFSRLSLHFFGGDRAPLINPPDCGNYQIVSELSPWSAADPANPTAAETVVETSKFRVLRGPDGGPCPRGTVDPSFNAGLANPTAAASGPFNMQLHRVDGTQRFAAFGISLPPGLTASLRGLAYCPDAVLNGISGAEGAGRAELAAPSCPAASRIGSVSTGVGAGPHPYYVQGQAYLAGPYKGAPVSIAVVVPAVAGPFDLGNVVVRSAVHVNQVTAEISVQTDPIPRILHGLLLDVRDIRVSIDRRDFTRAPTNCEPMSVNGAVQGVSGGNAPVSTRFQVGGCEALGFKPHMNLRLRVGARRGARSSLSAVARPGPRASASASRKVRRAMRRGGNPALRAVVTMPGYVSANIKRVSVALPHSAFLDQGHIRTICTRVQFAEGNGHGSACPKGSIYGKVKAWSPLLGYMLQGNVYLRSSSHKLPDLVPVLEGPAWQPIAIVLDGRIDSKHAQIRTTFEGVPDAPVSRFVLEMPGGKRGLIENSENLCSKRARKRRATVNFIGQNGKVKRMRPAVRPECPKRAKAKHRHRRGHSRKHSGPSRVPRRP